MEIPPNAWLIHGRLTTYLYIFKTCYLILNLYKLVEVYNTFKFLVREDNKWYYKNRTAWLSEI